MSVSNTTTPAPRIYGSDVPALPHSCNSWVVVNPLTGKSVVEIFEKDTAANIRSDRFLLVSTLEWLHSLNDPEPMKQKIAAFVKANKLEAPEPIPA